MLYDEINQASDLPVLATVSPSLHPSAILEWGKVLAAPDSPSTAPAYKSARQAQGLLYNALALVEDAHATAVAQHSKPAVDSQGKKIVGVMQEMPDAAKVQLANAMTEAHTAVAHKFDAHLGTINEAVEAIESSISKQLTPPKLDSVVASDLRKIVSTQGDPMGFLAGCLADGDADVIHAVLQTSPRASGLSKEQYALLKNELAPEALCKKEVTLLKALKQTRETVLRSAVLFNDRFTKLLPVVKPTAANTARERLKGAA